MDDRMEWALSLDDEISGPGKKMAGALDTVDRKLKATGDASERSSKRMAIAAKDAAEAHSFLLLQMDALMNMAGRVGGFLEGIGRKAYSFGEYAVEAASFKEDTLTALEAVLGSKKEATEVFKQGIAFAAKTPFETQDISRWQKTLLVGGYTVKETTNLLRTLTEVGSFNELKTDKVDNLAAALARLHGQGAMSGDVLESLRSAGVQDVRIFAELNKIMGTTAFQPGPLFAPIREQMFKIVDAGTAALAIERAVAGIGGGHLMEKASKNVRGLLSTIRSRPFELLMDFDATPGYASLKKFLANVAHVLDPTADTGKKIQSALLGTLTGAFEKVFGNLNTVSEESIRDGILKGIDVVAGLGRAAFAGVGAALEAALGGTKGMWDELTGPNREEAFKRLTKVAEDFGTSLGKIAASMMKIGGYITVVADGIDRAMHPIDTAIELAKVSRRPEVNDSSWAALAPDAQRRVMRLYEQGMREADKRGRVGSFDVVGIDNPMDFVGRLPPNRSVGSPQLYSAKAQADTFSAPTSSYVSPVAVRASARAPSITVEVVQHIQGGANASAKAIADEALQRIRAQLPAELMAAWEQISLEMGGG